MFIAQIISAFFGSRTVTSPAVTATVLTVLDAYKINSVLVLTAESGGTGSFIDSSDNKLTVTASGTPGQGVVSPYYAPGYYSNYFNGSTDYLTIPTNAAWRLRDTNFTVELWFYPTGNAGAWRQLVGTRSSAGATSWQLTISNINGLNYYDGVTYTTGQTIALNTWYHLAVVRNSTTMTFYLNGVSVYSNALNPNTGGDTQPLGIGANAFDGSEKFAGYISNLRIVKGSALYTSAFTPSTTPLTVIPNISLLTCQSNRFIDNSVLSSTLTVTGSPKISSFQPFAEIKSITDPTVSGLKSVYFNGSTDYLTMASGLSQLQFGSNNFTVECWVYPTSSTVAPILCGQSDLNTVGGSAYVFYIGGTTQTTDLYIGGGSTSLPSTKPTLNSWSHVAWVRNGSSFTAYLNGTQVGTVSVSGGINVGSAAYSPSIGAFSNGGNKFSGYISNLRIVKGTAVYTGNFIPTTTELTAITNTSLLTFTGTNPMIDSSTNALTITPSGAPQVKNFSPFDATPGANIVANTYNSTYFNGTSDYLTIPTNTALALSADFTVEMWVYPINWSGSNITLVSGATNSPQLGQYGSSANLGLAAQGTSWIITDAALPAVKSWSHVALTRSGSTIRIFINGSQSGSTASNAISFVAITKIGSIDTSYFNGYISNLRIVKGTAVYTAAFTPSTTPLTTTSQSVTASNVSLLALSGNNQLTDLSSNAFSISMTGSPRAQLVGPFAANSTIPGYYGSMYFNGSTDYLTIPFGSAFTFTSNFTIECWVYINVLPTTGAQRYIVASWDAGATKRSFYFILQESSGYKLALGLSADGGSTNRTDNVFSWSNPQINAWYHLAVVRNGNTVTAYVNGVSIGSGTNTISSNPLGNLVSIGADYPGLTAYWNGYISNLRIVKGTAVYTAAFTPSTTPLTAITNTVLLTCAAATSGGVTTPLVQNTGIALTATGSPAFTAFGPFTSYTPLALGAYGGSMCFDGSSYLTIPYTTSRFDWFTSDYTLEYWIYANSFVGGGNTNDSPVIGNMTVGGTGSNWAFGPIAGGIVKFYWYTTGINHIGSTAIPANTWNHLALTYVASTKVVTIWINGASNITYTVSGTPASGTNIPLLIGRANNSFFNGYISNLRIVKGTAVYTGNFIPSTTPVTAITNTQLLLSANNTELIDATGNNDIVPSTSSSMVSTAQTKFGSKSIYFDGSTSLSVPFSPNFAFGTGDFTIEGWFYFTNLNISQRGLVALGDGANGTGPVYNSWGLLYLGTEGSNQISLGRYDGTSYAFTTSGLTLVANTWTHIAVSRAAGTLRIFVNGVAYYSAANSTNYSAVNTNPLRIALQYYGPSSGYSGPRYWPGYIDDLRITNGVGRYTANFTPVDTSTNIDDIYLSSTQLYLRGDAGVLTNTVTDSSANNFTITKGGTPGQGTFSPSAVGYYSTYFNGTTDYLTVPSNAIFNIGSNNVTIETWFYVTAWTGGVSSPIWSMDAGGGNTFAYIYNSTGKLGVGINGTNEITSATGAVSLNTWYHFATVRNGTTSTLYLNGVSVGSGTTGIWAQTGDRPFYIGSNVTQYYFNGYISNLRFVKGTAVYTGNFTPSTTPLTAISGTSLLTCYDGTIMVDQTPGSTSTTMMTVSGTPRTTSWSPFVKAFDATMAGSYYFNGSSDYLTVPSTAVSSIGTGAFTIEGWFYSLDFTVRTTYFQRLWSFGNGISNDVTLNLDTSGYVVYRNNDAILITSSVAAPLNAWYHVTVVRSGTTTSVYLNGANVGSTSTSNNLTSPGGYSLNIGNESGSTRGGYFIGYISNFRVVQGTAQYSILPLNVPSAELTLVGDSYSANTTLLLNGNLQNAVLGDTIVDTSTNALAITRTGTPTINASSPFTNAGASGNSIYLSGPTTRLTVPSNAAFSLGNGDFTVEFWALIPTWADQAQLVGCHTAFGGFDWLIQQWSGGQFRWLDSTLVLQSGFAPTVNQWNHYAVTRSSGTLRIFVNGSQKASGNSSANISSTKAFGILADTGGNAAQPGYISNLRIVKGTALYTDTFVPSTTPLTAVTNTSFLLSTQTLQNNTFVDSSSNALTVTANGSSSQNAFSPFTNAGNSAYFNGSTDSLTIGYNSVLELGAVNFTIEFWVYAISGNSLYCWSSDQHYAMSWNYGGANANRIGIWASSTGSSWNIFNADGGGNGISTGTLSTNTWTHIALVRNGSAWALYLNGTSAWTGSSSATIVTRSTDTFRIAGPWPGSGPGLLSGYISNFRIVKGTALYTGTFVPSTTPLTTTSQNATTATTSLLLNFSNLGVIDNSSFRNGVSTIGDAKISTAVKKFGTGSLYFDGTGDSLYIPWSSNLELGSGDFTIEFWTYWVGGTVFFCWSVDQHIGLVGNYGGAGSDKLGLFASSNGSSWNIFNADGGGNGITSSACPKNTWAHVAIVRNGTDWGIYINGTRSWTGSSSATIVTRSTDTFRIAGPWPGSGPSAFNGYLDDFRITKGVARFASTLKNFIPSTAVLTQTSQGATAATTSLLLTAQNSNLIDSTIKNNFTIVGNVTTSTSTVKAGATSMYFDGSSYAFANGQPNHFSSGDFTVELWVYFTTVTTSTTVIDYRPLSTSGAYFTLWMNTLSQFTYFANAAERINGPTPMANTWYHVAVVRLGGNTKMYVNGIQVGATYADSTVYLSGANRPIIGSDGYTPAGKFTGYIDDFRVSNVARYTANFYTGPYTASSLSSTVSVAANVSSAYLKLSYPITFTITTTNLPNGTILNWANTGTSSSSYFTDGVNAGSVTVVNNTATVTRTTLASTSVSAATLILSISNLTGTVLATSASVSLSTALPASVSATYLIVAGGGGGGGGYTAAGNSPGGGGGGAGGLLSGSTSLSSATSYTVTVGGGGSGGAAGALGTTGTNSSITGLTAAVGGGGGGSYPGGGGLTGGSGGGGTTSNATYLVGGSATSGQGFAGGTGGGYYGGGGGGGGGSSAVGANASTNTPGAGGAGTSSSITGSAVFYAGGGGGGSGGAGSGVGAGGTGGGGAGSNSAAGTAGTTNLGGGGGGGGPTFVGGAGGSGIVIISYSGAQVFAGGTVTFVGGNTIHTFTTSGTLA
jgi:hypothetical protein